MLVLTRRKGERIVFPDLDATVTVLSVKGNSVSLGIAAPPDIDIDREEVVLRNDVSRPRNRPKTGSDASGALDDD